MGETIKTTFETEFLTTGAEAAKKATLDMCSSHQAYAEAISKSISADSKLAKAFDELKNKGKSTGEALRTLKSDYLNSAQGAEDYAASLVKVARANSESAKAFKGSFVSSSNDTVGNPAKNIVALTIAEKAYNLHATEYIALAKKKENAMNNLIQAQTKLSKVAGQEPKAQGNTEAWMAKQVAWEERLAKARENVTTQAYKEADAMDRLTSYGLALQSAQSRIAGSSAAEQKSFRELYLTAADYANAMKDLRAQKESYALSNTRLSKSSTEYRMNQEDIIKIDRELIMLEREKARAFKDTQTVLAKPSNPPPGATKTMRTLGDNTAVLNRPAVNDTYMLANLRRLGAISPQVAQLSYVLEAITSTGMLAAVAITSVGTGLITMGVAAVKAAGELQGYQVTLQGLATNGWDKQAKNSEATLALGKAVSSGMIDYATKSTYAFEKIAQGTEKLAGYGIDMRAVNGEMEMLGNLALGDSKRLENLAVAYGQVYGQGKARAQEMYQFVNAGIPIFEILAQKLNISTAAVMDMTRGGEITFSLMRDTLKELTAEGGKYHELMLKIANLSFGGQMTMLMNNLKVMLADMGTVILPQLTEAIADTNRAIANSRKDKTIKEVVGIATSRERDQFKLAAYDTIATEVGDAAYNALKAQKARAALAKELPSSDAARFDSLKKALYTTPAPISPELLEKPGAMTLADVRTKADQEKVQVLKQRAIWLDNQTKAYGELFKFLETKMGMDPQQLEELKNTVPKFGVESTIGTAALGRYVSDSERFMGSTADTGSFDAALQNFMQNMSRKDVTAGEQKFMDDWERIQKLRNVGVEGSMGDKEGEDKTRNYELPKYNEDIRLRIEQLAELNPLYKEFVAIEQMRQRDVTPDKNGLFMTEKEAAELKRMAMLRYADSKALELYGEAYTAVQEYKNANITNREQEIKEALERTAALIKEKGIAIEEADAYLRLTTAMAKVGATTAGAISFMTLLNDAFGDKKASHIEAYMENIEDLQKVLGLTADGATYLSDTLKRLAGTHGDNTVTAIVTALANEKNKPKMYSPREYNRKDAMRRERLGFGPASEEGIDSTSWLTYVADRASGGNNPKFKKQYLADAYAGLGISDYKGTEQKAWLAGNKLEKMRTGEGGLDEAITMTDALADIKDPTEETTAALKKQEEVVDGLAAAYMKASTAAELWDVTLKNMADQAFTISMTSMNDAIYALAFNLSDATREQKNLADAMVAWRDAMINMIPSVLVSGASAAFGKGQWEVGLAMLAASGLASVAAGILGTQEQDKSKEDDSAELRALENLRAQFAIMVQQFQTNISYLDVARSRYAVDQQQAIMTGYALGDAFPGSTGLPHGVYNQATPFRFATGGTFNGVMGEAGPEAIMPLSRGADGKLGVKAAVSSGGIIINNYAGADVKASEQTDEKGNKQTIVTIEKMVGNMLGSGKFDTAMAARYGSRPQPLRRSQ